MFGWLKRRVDAASVNVMKKELESFTAGLKGADDAEIATMLVVANILRLNLTAMEKIPEAALDYSIPRDQETEFQCSACPIALGRAIKHFQKLKQPSDAFGVMVWLHSVRALNVPELRFLGRKMWKELERGFPYVEDALQAVQTISGNPMPPNIENALRFIPVGLEPRN